MRVEMDLKKSVEANASAYYDKIKKLKKRIFKKTLHQKRKKVTS